MASQSGPASGQLNVSSPPQGQGFHVRFSENEKTNLLNASHSLVDKEHRVWDGPKTFGVRLNYQPLTDHESSGHSAVFHS